MTAAPLVFFHTAEVHRRTFADLARELAPEIPLRHVVAPHLLDEAVRRGGVDAALAAQVEAALAGAARDAAVVVCTCSTLGPVAERFGAAGEVPILRLDRAMAENAVARGRRIVVAACVATTLAATRELIESEALRQQRDVAVDMLFLPDAWPLFERGDTDAYLDAIAAALETAAARADVIVLAQASMAGAAARCRDLRVPVLSSPRPGVEMAVHVWQQRAADDADGRR